MCNYMGQTEACYGDPDRLMCDERGGGAGGATAGRVELLVLQNTQLVDVQNTQL